MQSINNKTLINRLNNGDESSMVEVYEIFYKPLYGMAYRYLRSKELAEDALQDVFIKLWKNKNSLDNRKSLQGFLFSTLKNHILNQIRSNTRRVIRNYEYLQLTSGETDTPESVIIGCDDKRLYKLALKFLPDTKRQVFNLQKDGFTYEEISEKLGISINTVRSHLYQSRKFINDFTKKHNDPKVG